MRLLALTGVAILAASCTTAYPTVAQQERQARELQRELAGRVAGEPIRCLPTYRARDMLAIDEQTILFRDGRTTYVSRMNGGCSGLGSAGYTLITKTIGGSNLCGGDIAQVADVSSRMVVGSCTFGDFVPYTRP
jgi:hypothetical protein